METVISRRNSTEGAKYTVGVKTYKKIESNRRVRMREVKIYRNGAWIYCDAFQEEERAVHERWAKNFLRAMKRNDARSHLAQPDQMKEA